MKITKLLLTTSLLVLVAMTRAAVAFGAPLPAGAHLTPDTVLNATFTLTSTTPSPIAQWAPNRSIRDPLHKGDAIGTISVVTPTAATTCLLLIRSGSNGTTASDEYDFVLGGSSTYEESRTVHTNILNRNGTKIGSGHNWDTENKIDGTRCSGTANVVSARDQSPNPGVYSTVIRLAAYTP